MRSAVLRALVTATLGVSGIAGLPAAAGAPAIAQLVPTVTSQVAATSAVRHAAQHLPRADRSRLPHDLVTPGRVPGRGVDHSAAARHKRVTRVLVILTYWSHRDPFNRAYAKRVVITDANTWYRRASYGRQGLTGTATGWLHVHKPAQCGSIDEKTIAAAKHAARRYHPSRYDRIVIYQPCSIAGGAIGVGEEPGSVVILARGGMNMPTAVHEQGHNYGLGHANQLVCSEHGRRSTYRKGAHCQEVEYTDLSSAMAAEWNPKYAGDFTAPQKHALGWLGGRVRTVNGARKTVSLAPYETRSGTKAIQVRGSHGRTYWVEYRTRRGNDTHLEPQFEGVLVHMSRHSSDFYQLDQSLQLDTVPPNTDSSLFSLQTSPAYLPDHSSWTTPDGIRITVDSESSGGARVTVVRHANPRRPGVVRRIGVTALDRAASVTFRRASDGGLPVRKYTITASPGGAHATVRNYGSADLLHATLHGLKDGVFYRFSIRASNELGTGPATTSAKVSPHPLYPRPLIVSPRAGASVSNIVRISVQAKPNAKSKSPISQLEVDVDNDGGALSSVYGSHGVVKWDTGMPGWAVGKHRIILRATDENGRTKSTSITVQLTQTTGPIVRITGPTGSHLSGEQQITGTVAPNPAFNRKVTYLEVDIDGSYLTDVEPPTASWAVEWNTDDFSAGKHVITVTATDTKGDTSIASRTVTVG